MLDDLNLPMFYDHDTSAHAGALHYSTMTPGQQPHMLIHRVVLLTRDPRDTAVSGYFQVANRLEGYGSDIAAFIRDPHYGVEKIVRFNLAWAKLASRFRTVLTITYEELHVNPVATLSRVATFLGQPRSSAEIRRAVEAGDFERMQQKERSGEYAKRYGAVLSPRASDDANSLKVRRGKIGGYRDYLNDDDLKFCDDIFHQFRYFEQTEEMAKESLARHG